MGDVRVGRVEPILEGGTVRAEMRSCVCGRARGLGSHRKQ